MSIFTHLYIQLESRLKQAENWMVTMSKYMWVVYHDMYINDRDEASQALDNIAFLSLLARDMHDLSVYNVRVHYRFLEGHFAPPPSLSFSHFSQEIS